jgi:hypothetical protein
MDVVRMNVYLLEAHWNPIPIDLVICWVPDIEETIPDSIIVHETHVPNVNPMLVVCFWSIVIGLGNVERLPISP